MLRHDFSFQKSQKVNSIKTQGHNFPCTAAATTTTKKENENFTNAITKANIR